MGVDQFVIPARRPSNPPLNTRWREYPDKPASPQAIGRIVEEVAIRAGIAAHVYPHLLRHAYGDHVAKYAGLRAAQALLGHASVDTTASTYVDKPGLDELAVSVQGFRYRPIEGYPPPNPPQSRIRDSFLFPSRAKIGAPNESFVHAPGA